MKKNKKKKAGKKVTMLSGAKKSLKKLSTTQKVLAGATLGAIGIRYLVKKLGQPKVPAASPDTTYIDDAAMAENNLTSLEE